MASFKEIVENPNKEFTLKEISQALRTSKMFVYDSCKKHEIKYRVINNGDLKTFLVKGSDVVEYLTKLNSTGFKSLADILSTYSLPHERK